MIQAENAKQKTAPNMLVIYHDHCVDGLAAAWVVAERAMRDAGGHNISFTGYSHHDKQGAQEKILSSITPGMSVLFVDVAPERDFLDHILSMKHAGKVFIIDHHRTAAQMYQSYMPPQPNSVPLEIYINENHPSAASMIWDMFMDGAEKPGFIKMIEKMDVGLDLRTEDDFAAAAMIDSKDITSVDGAFKAFDELNRMTQEEMTAHGRSILTDQKNRIAKLEDNVMLTDVFVGGEMREAPIVNADVQSFGRMISFYLREKGRAHGSDVAFAWYVQGNGKVTVSVRTSGEGDADASAIADDLIRKGKADGGGHKTSAALHFDSLADFHACFALRPRTKAPKPGTPADVAPAAPTAPRPPGA